MKEQKIKSIKKVSPEKPTYRYSIRVKDNHNYFMNGGVLSKNSIMIMEEAQNMSPLQMKTLLTRIGKDSKYIINGDLDQSDRYKNVKDSGLYDALEKHSNIEEIGMHEFHKDDIVRNPLITKILDNY